MHRLPDCENGRGPNGEDPDHQSPGPTSSETRSRHWKSRNGTVGRPAGEPVRPADRAAPVPQRAEVHPIFEQLRQLLLAEAMRFRQNASVSMAVVVCVNERTELLVHFTQRDGGVHASARCERGDTQQLHTFWPALKQALALRRVQLAPLRSSLPDRFLVGSASLPCQHPQRRRRKSGAPTRRPGWETWA